MSPARRRRRAQAPSREIPASSEPSPAQRFAAFREHQRVENSMRHAYVSSLPFTPDDFQIQAMDALEKGTSVLVAAPTGAGKTIVGEFATYLASERGDRAFYTTPIKALSNQKFLELRERYGEDEVGLLTGDTSIHPDAPIVVMTTEVLRNMLYVGADLSRLTHVILDEVHYLADRFRGPVWEEVMIHLPEHVHLVALSATVSNAEEFGAWMSEIRGSCEVIVSENRPVPLYQHMLVGETIYDLYAPSRSGQGRSQRVNPELLAATSIRGRREHRRWESRPGALISLDRAHLLPAIVFIFSRAGCEDAVSSVLASGIALTSASEAREIRQWLEDVTRAIPVEDHAVIGVDRWIRACERGIAAHHAGMLPLMKEAVEQLFARGLLKVVYATETLALGINMPARTVVIESLQKWNGAEHVHLSAGEFTQLSGRAGRRGIDTEGHVVVTGRGRIEPEEVAALASKRTYPLVSAFHPTYNMVTNLLAHSTRAATREVLESSYAQFQADGAVVQQARRAKEYQRRAEALRREMTCEMGDASEYFAMRDRLARMEKQVAKEQQQARRQMHEDLLAGMRPGDVLLVGKGRRTRRYVVVDTYRSAGFRVLARTIGTDGQWHTVGSDELSAGAANAGHLPLPSSSAALRRHRERRALGERLMNAPLKAQHQRDVVPLSGEEEIAQLRRELRQHPVHRCPEREMHAHSGHRWARENREYERVMALIDGHTNSVAKEFDRVCQVLDELGFLNCEQVTSAGEDLRRIFGERALTVVESVRAGLWNDLSAPELCAMVSTCVYESRGERETSLRSWSGSVTPALSAAWQATTDVAQRIAEVEKRVGAPLSPQPDAGVAGAVLAWAHGATLTTSVEDTEIQAGDFVRWVRQVVDLLDQLRHIASEGLRVRLEEARRLILRGVVQWSLA